MTDKTQPEALRLAEWCDANSAGIYRKSAEAAAELRRQHARIAELEAELEAVGAGGVQALSQKKATPASADKAQAAINSGAGGVQALSAAPAEYVGNGMFKGETIQQAAEHWANWCDVRYMTGLSEFLRVVAASPTPPAEQQATTTEAALGVEPVSVYAKLPEALLTQYDDIDGEEFGCFAEGQMRDFADRTHALRMEQEATKAAPAWADQAVIEYRYTGGTHWCPLGPAERMKPNFDGVYRLQGGVFPVEQAAPKAAPTWPSEALVWEALQAYLKHDTNMEGMRAALIVGAAPQQEAQEPYGYVYTVQVAPIVGDERKVERTVFTRIKPPCYAIALYTAPRPAPAPLSDEVVKDAARWRMVALIGYEVMLHPEKRTQAASVKAYMDATHSGSDLTGAVDAAIAAQGGK